MAVSCNIGNFMTPGSPMVSYIFDGESLAGLGAEVIRGDIIDDEGNGIVAKDVFNSVNEEGITIGEAGRRSSFLVIGDPFLKI